MRSAPATRARIEVHFPPRARRAINSAALKAAARAALDMARVKRRVVLTVVVTGDAALRKLNRDFLGIDAPTDVLSFAFSEIGAGLRPRQNRARSETFAQQQMYLGDVVISLARARAQAKSGGHALIDELQLLVIHGVLHLLGHDHDTPERKRRMWVAQAKALRKVRASIEEPAEE